jgi:hypothetical protein
MSLLLITFCFYSFLRSLPYQLGAITLVAFVNHHLPCLCHEHLTLLMLLFRSLPYLTTHLNFSSFVSSLSLPGGRHVAMLPNTHSSLHSFLPYHYQACRFCQSLLALHVPQTTHSFYVPLSFLTLPNHTSELLFFPRCLATKHSLFSSFVSFLPFAHQTGDNTGGVAADLFRVPATTNRRNRNDDDSGSGSGSGSSSGSDSDSDSDSSYLNDDKTKKR